MHNSAFEDLEGTKSDKTARDKMMSLTLTRFEKVGEGNKEYQ
jgi:hypothetical protein